LSQNRIKVLHLISPKGIGGAERLVLTYMKHFDRKSIDASLVVFSNETSGDSSFLTAAEGLGISMDTIRFGTPYSVSQLIDLYRIARRRCPHVIHAHGYKTDILGFAVARAMRLSIVTSVHGTHGLNGRSNTMLWIDEQLTRHFDCVITVSQEITDHLLLQKVPPGKMVTIRNIPPPQEYVLYEDTSSFREEMGIDACSNVVGFVGRLEHVKGCDQLIRAFAVLKEVCRDPQLVIVGEGTERRALEKLAKETGLEKRIQFCGFRSDTARIYRSLDLLVLPSRHEGIPLTLLEAMAMGVPVVATKVGGMPEVVEDRVTGLLVDADSPEALAAAITEALEIKDETRARTLNARKMIEREYDVAEWAGKIQAVYENVMR
jgi:glycosyltransferase involved in cell wall biosynthesis